MIIKQKIIVYREKNQLTTPNLKYELLFDCSHLKIIFNNKQNIFIPSIPNQLGLQTDWNGERGLI